MKALFRIQVVIIMSCFSALQLRAQDRPIAVDSAVVVTVADTIYNGRKLPKNVTAPTFEGRGLAAFKNWLSERVDYPLSAIENGTQGTVVLEFVVGKQGKVCDMKVIRNPATILTGEVLRVITLSPPWTPAMCDGERVNVRYKIDMEFSLAR